MQFSKLLLPSIVLLSMVKVSALVVAAENASLRPVYLDSAQPVEKRIDDLMSRMRTGSFSAPNALENMVLQTDTEFDFALCLSWK